MKKANKPSSVGFLHISTRVKRRNEDGSPTAPLADTRGGFKFKRRAELAVQLAARPDWLQRCLAFAMMLARNRTSRQRFSGGSTMLPASRVRAYN